jgi:hypothetical protein
VVELGARVPGPCGLKDRYGLSWQIVSKALIEMIEDPDTEAARRDGGDASDEQAGHRGAAPRVPAKGRRPDRRDVWRSPRAGSLIVADESSR